MAVLPSNQYEFVKFYPYKLRVIFNGIAGACEAPRTSYFLPESGY